MATRGLIAAKLPTLPIGEHGDGGWLYFIVEEGVGDAINRRWGFRFPTPEGRKWKKIGPFPDVGLKEARGIAADWTKLVREGGDPRSIGKTTTVTLKAFIDEHLADFVKDKSAGEQKNWRSAIERMEPLFDKPIADIKVSDVTAWLRPIWDELPVTGERVLGKLSQIIESAISLEVRENANPARWAIIKRTNKFTHARKLQPVEHHAALHYNDVPAFMKLLAYEMTQNRIAGSCVMFAVLCALRSQEAREARWSWLNSDMTVLTIPAEYMKARKEHVVPLPTQVTELLKSLPRDGELIFPSQKQYGNHEPMLSNTLLLVLQRIPGGEAITLHGFRSSFRQYVGEKTRTTHHVAEYCLAHAIGENLVERAYLDGALFLDDRRVAMQAWADFATGSVPANVLPFKRVA